MKRVWMVIKSKSRRLLYLLLLAVLLASLVVPVLPQQVANAETLEYPVLKDGVQYYQTTFPAGLRYSPGWYGTFTNAPRADKIWLFDDDYSKDWGICVFSMPIGKVPKGEQGGTSLAAITKIQADSIIKSYPLRAVVEPFDPEISAVMQSDAYFTGAWAGDKLTTKWNSNLYERPPTEKLTYRQLDYIFTTTVLSDTEKNGYLTKNQTSLTLTQKSTLKAIIGKSSIKLVDLTKFDPDRYWVPNSVSGNWSNTAMWANASGNMSGGASVPTNADNVFFDINSFNSTNKTVLVDVTANCLSMDWTGATNTPTLAGANSITLKFYGNVTLISGMSVTAATLLNSYGTGKTFTSAGLNLGNIWLTIAEGPLTLGGTYTSNRRLSVSGGTFDTANFAVTLGAGDFYIDTATAKTLTLGSSVITCTGFSYTGSNLTLTANTATINVSGTGVGTFGDANYNGATFNFNGTAHTLSGSSTNITAITLLSTTTQTITINDSSNISATTLNLSGTSGHQHTLQGSGVGGWNISQSAGTVTADYITISRSTANTTGGQVYNAVGGSVDSGNNVGWNFPLTAATVAANPVTMDKDGVTAVVLRGTITDMGGNATVKAWFDYGLTLGYGLTTTNVTYSTTNFTGIKSNTSNLVVIPGQTYHFRRAVTGGTNTTQGLDLTFDLTMPTVTTGVATDVVMNGGTHATLNANTSSMGVASSFYAYYQWGYSTAYGYSTPVQTITGVGNIPATISGYNPTNTVYYRIVYSVGGLTIYGADQSTNQRPTGSSYQGFQIISLVPVAFGLLVFALIFGLASRIMELGIVETIISAACGGILGTIGMQILIGLINQLLL